jgi:hypothetical protein
MQPYAPNAPSRAEALIAALRDPTKPQGELRPLCLEAAAEIERLRAQEYRLAARIHNQRAALRDTWQIVEQRRKWLGSSSARQRYHWLWKQYQALKAKIA